MNSDKNSNDNAAEHRGDAPRKTRPYVRAAGLVLMLAVVPIALANWVRSLPHLAQAGEDARNGEELADLRRDEQRDFHAYVWGVGLAVLLTVVPFALVKWFPAISPLSLYIVIGIFALVQMLVHFRFFLHIGLGQNRDDLQLLLFSALVLIIMVAGTLWIMTSLAWRMALPGSP